MTQDRTPIDNDVALRQFGQTLRYTYLGWLTLNGMVLTLIYLVVTGEFDSNVPQLQGSMTGAAFTYGILMFVFSVASRKVLLSNLPFTDLVLRRVDIWKIGRVFFVIVICLTLAHALSAFDPLGGFSAIIVWPELGLLLILFLRYLINYNSDKSWKEER